MKRGRKVLRRQKTQRAPKECYFCKDQKEPVFSDAQTLSRFLTERGKIIPRVRSGLCTKHQKSMALSIKYARHLALLPFLSR